MHTFAEIVQTHQKSNIQQNTLPFVTPYEYEGYLVGMAQLALDFKKNKPICY